MRCAPTNTLCGKIERRGNIWWICYVGLDGRKIRDSSESDKFQDAKTMLTGRKHSIEIERKQPDRKKIQNFTFAQLAEEYMTWVTGRQNSAKVKGYIIGQLVQVFGNLPLRKFSKALVEKHQTDLINRGLKPASNNKIVNVLKHMFSKAVDWETVEPEVLKGMKKGKLFKEDKRHTGADHGLSLPRFAAHVRFTFGNGWREPSNGIPVTRA